MHVITDHNEFRKYAVHHRGINSNTFDQYAGEITNMTRSVIEERDMPFREVDVFSRLIADRIIFVGTELSHEVANIIQAQLLFLESSDPSKDIQIYINTPGGSVYGGLGVYDTMQYISCKISTICTGIAASLGAVILAAGATGKRYALKHSRIMLHQPSGYTGGQASDIDIAVKEVLRTKQDLYEILSYHTGQTVQQIEKDAQRDFWMSSEEAKEYGLIDQVIFREKK
ncbi:MAG: ATP-dependent Clp protease proteolytic subunit [Bacteroidales bacterium]|jgi:ATP-dependent Clp protease protease subunit|nr:ATP-dependent Clp protease proteolytic subunit [Bacteroidales bacterium]MBO7565855.1 ATP-dependent Clp protease proteolytic subunit [Bacteroidales bacterium]MBQ4408167.1 ATP-dependent Clp protease proteolytic subunit [Bacteroidales bacterium]